MLDSHVLNRMMFYKLQLGLSARTIAELEMKSVSSVYRYLRNKPSDSEKARLSVVKLAKVTIQPFKQASKRNAIVIGAINELTGFVQLAVHYESDLQTKLEKIACALTSCIAVPLSSVDFTLLLRNKRERLLKPVFDDLACQLQLCVEETGVQSPIAERQIKLLRKRIRQIPPYFESMKHASDQYQSTANFLNGQSTLRGAQAFVPNEAHLQYSKSIEDSLSDGKPQYHFVDIKEVVVHPDGHIEYDHSYYSVPHVFVGKSVWLRASSTCVSVFTQEKQIALHKRNLRPRQYSTDGRHMPKSHIGRPTNPVILLSKAMALGKNVGRLVEKWLSLVRYPEHIYRRFLALMRACEGCSRGRLNQACFALLDRGEYRVRDLKRELSV